jgi:hypothetical protein
MSHKHSEEGINMYDEPVKWFSFVYSKSSSMGTSFDEYTIPIIWGTMMRDNEAEEGMWGGREPTQTHHTVDCHDFAEDDAVCGGHFLAGCVSRKE